MSTRTRRRIIRVCIALAVLALAANVVKASLPGHHSWGWAFSSVATGVVCVVCGLAYLRYTRGAR